MQPFQPTYRRFILIFVFALLVTLAGISQLSQVALAKTNIIVLSNRVFLPLISNALDVGGTIPPGQ